MNPDDYPWDGEPIDEAGEEDPIPVNAWPEWVKQSAREVDVLCNYRKGDNNG